MHRRTFLVGASAALAAPEAALAARTHGALVQPDTDVEIAIIGGGPAGLTAALVLGRSRRKVALFDAGDPRNAPAAAAHNFFTRDGTAPLELNRIGREQLAPYRSVEVHRVRVSDAERRSDGIYAVREANGKAITAQHVILATGVVDVLPEIEGLRSLWGSGVFHCPYCHGWEVQDQPFVLLAQGPRALHLAHILRGWTGQLTLCTVGAFTLEAEDHEALQALGVEVRAPAEAVVGAPDGTVADVILADGTRTGPAAVFTSAPIRQRSELPVKLGAELHTEGMFEGTVKVDPRGFAGVPGLWVVGDASQGFPQVISAANDGAIAGAMINAEMLMAGLLPRGAQR